MRSMKAPAIAAIATAAMAGSTLMLAGPASAAEQSKPGTPSGTVSAAAENYTVACNTPGDTANFSWKSGTVNTTVYFNNHCGHSVNITLEITDLEGPQNHCLTTEAGEKGKKKYQTGASGSITHVSRGC
ncbi:hypothetical protein [Streptomyces cucumeris]|uniref:hypothetical protein n=1 Tax=Streptomyces cucumeris TaxID=2962890 RepID=UPI0020C897E7|nr:hypothetical protein [Streptomyces sp. NEAU-Y11]MCP9212880.1 hypothetical protein [Streptomyces sp. NEAU-Y11]